MSNRSETPRTLNLIQDPWIPIRRRSGRGERITPWQVTKKQDPVVALASGRADFDGALGQFLVGLLQSCCPPESGRAWRRWADTPPDEVALRAAMEPLASYFELFGEGPRFLQDFTLTEEEGKRQAVGKLLIELGSETLFVDPASVTALCLPCAATALLTLQTNAPSGGRGHRTSLRGGGPLTTMVITAEEGEASFWRFLWLNVLDRATFERRAGCDPTIEGPEHRFPWLAQTRLSESKTAGSTSPPDVHPLQHFWGMPRRIRLEASPVDEQGCSLCTAPSAPIQEYITRHSGVNYEGDFHHPLSPHSQNKQGNLFPVKGSDRGLSYRDWLGFALGDESRGRVPATVVQQVNQDSSRRDRAKAWGGLRLWAFGFDMDNMKARSWNEGRMPLFLTDTEEERAALAYAAGQLIEAAQSAQTALKHAVKALHFRRPQDQKKNPEEAAVRFWEGTQTAFYPLLEELGQAADLSSRQTVVVMQRWHGHLVRVAQGVFDSYTTHSFRGVDPAQQARAWHGLRRNLFGKKIRGILGLENPSPRKES